MRFCARCGSPLDFAQQQAPEEPHPAVDPGLTVRHRRWVLPVTVVVLTLALVGLGGYLFATRHSPQKDGAAPTLSASAKPTSSAPTASPTASPASFASLYAEDKSGVVKILASTCDLTGEGTGFLVGRHLVATAEHVVDGEVAFEIKAHGLTYTGRVIGSNPTTDVALIRTRSGIPGHIFHLTTTDPAVGAGVAVVGYPDNGPLTFTAGTVAALDGNVNLPGLRRSHLVETDATINHGNSGGPLLDTDNHVIGLADLIRPNTHGLYYAVDSLQAGPLLTEWRAVPRAVPPATCTTALGPQTGRGVDVPLPPGDTNVQAVVAPIVTYFDGINSGNYAQAYNAETASAHHGQSLSEFSDHVATSYDNDFHAVSASANPDGSYNLEITFTSIQAPDAGPNGDTCDIWDLIYRLVPTSAGTYLIDAATPASGSGYSACH
jgi:S1-C subfamily serine protease